MEKTSLPGFAVRRGLPIRLADIDGWAPVALLAVAVALFAPLNIVGDGSEYYTFLQRLFGDASHAYGWVFGLALMNAPFYALGKLLYTLGIHSIDGSPTTQALVSLAGSVYMLLAAAIVARMLGVLRLPHRTFVVLAAVIGSPLLYYGLFLSTGTHAAETFLVTAASGLLLIALRRPTLELPIAAAVGIALGLATATRYSLSAMVVGLALVYLLYRRWLPAAIVVATSAATFYLAYLAPILTGSPILTEHGVSMEIGFAPLSPFRMLFTDERGLFVWTPVMLIGIIGFIHALLRRRSDREFLARIGGMQFAYWAFHFLVPMWWAGGSFSSRFFTSMFPLVAIGIGECLTWRPRLTVALASLATVWTLYLCLNIAAGIDVIRGNQRAGHVTSASDVALFPVNKHTTWRVYLYSIYYVSHFHR